MRVSPDTVAVLVLNPLRNGRSSMIDAGKTLNGVLELYTRLGDVAAANAMGETLQDMADIVQRLNVLIERIGAEAG